MVIEIEYYIYRPDISKPQNTQFPPPISKTNLALRLKRGKHHTFSSTNFHSLHQKKRMAPITNLSSSNGFAGLNGMITHEEISGSSQLMSVVPVPALTLVMADMVEVPELARPQETVVHTYPVTQTQTRAENTTTTMIYVLPGAPTSALPTTTITTITQTNTQTPVPLGPRIFNQFHPFHPLDIDRTCINMNIREPTNVSYTGFPFFALGTVHDHFTLTLSSLTTHLSRAYNTSVHCAWVAVSAALHSAERDLTSEIQKSGHLCRLWRGCPATPTTVDLQTRTVTDTANPAVTITLTRLLE